MKRRKKQQIFILYLKIEKKTITSNKERRCFDIKAFSMTGYFIQK